MKPVKVKARRSDNSWWRHSVRHEEDSTVRVAARRSAARIVAVAMAAFVAAPALPGASADPSPVFITPDAPWLQAVNYFREMAALPPVVEDAALSYGSKLHSCYMLQNGITHAEQPGAPGYTPEGNAAGQNGNVGVHSLAGTSERFFIELWMTGPFHAIGLLRPGLQRVGFGKCDNASAPLYRSAATLDVIRGLGAAPALTSPVLFPGDGMTTSLDRFQVEAPNPLSFCGWPVNGGAGLPVLALMPEPALGPVSSSIVGPNGPLETCTLSSGSTSGLARSIIESANAVITLPRRKLEPGSYTVTVITGARTVSWSFTIDPAAATGVMPPANPGNTPKAPISVASPSGFQSGFRPLSPVRVVDTREGHGATTVVGQVVTAIQVGGTNGIPAGAQAISANVTVTNTAGAGYLTVWNCAPDRPVVASVNFGAGETVANGVSVPIDSSGRLCVFSPVTTDLVVDVNGYYSDAGANRFSSITPTRLMDTRVPIGPSTRLAAGQVVALGIAGQAGIPTDAAAVALNVTSVSPTVDGYVTVWPCDQPQPFTASLNPVAGAIRPNLVISPVAADGSVCLFSSSEVDLVVDVTGYLSNRAAAKFEATVPFRFTDTREASTPELNAGTNGRVGAGQVLAIPIAGVRGVPASATAVSVNIAVTGATAPGFITAWPCGERPTTANVNYRVNAATSNGAQLPLSPDGQLCVYSMSSAHVIIDVNGWWA